MTAGLPPTGPQPPNSGLITMGVSGSVDVEPPQGPGDRAKSVITLAHGAVRVQAKLTADSAVEFLEGLTAQARQAAVIANGINGAGILPVSGDAMTQLPSITKLIEDHRHGPLHGPNGGR